MGEGGEGEAEDGSDVQSCYTEEFGNWGDADGGGVGEEEVGAKWEKRGGLEGEERQKSGYRWEEEGGETREATDRGEWLQLVPTQFIQT